MIHPWMSLYFAQRAQRMQRIRIQKYVYIYIYIYTNHKTLQGLINQFQHRKMAPSSPAQLPKPPDQVSSCIKVYRKICPLIESKESFLEWNTSRSVPIHHQIKSYLNQLLKKSYQMTFTTVTWFRNPKQPPFGCIPNPVTNNGIFTLSTGEFTGTLVAIHIFHLFHLLLEHLRHHLPEVPLSFWKYPTLIIPWKKRKHIYIYIAAILGEWFSGSC